jgi:hypothetical protein
MMSSVRNWEWTPRSFLSARAWMVARPSGDLECEPSSIVGDQLSMQVAVSKGPVLDVQQLFIVFNDDVTSLTWMKLAEHRGI